MSLIRLEHQEDDDRALLFRLQHIIAGAIRYSRPRYAHIVKIDNWFGARWRCFAGSSNGKDLHPKDRLAIPPFAPRRALLEATYRRHGDELRRISPRKLHEATITPSSTLRYLDDITPSGIYIWYSGNTANQDHGSLMVYEVEKNAEQRGWYAELKQRDGIWSVSSAIATSVNEIHELETSYGNRLAPLFPRARDERLDENRLLWEQILDTVYGSEIAQATVLIEKYKSRHPDNDPIRLLHARNLAQRRLFAAAEKEFQAIERSKRTEKWRCAWLEEWAEFCTICRNDAACEEAYRELASLKPDESYPWILFGDCLARQGKLEEAEATYRQATELEGDPDWAYLSLGGMLRAVGRFEEAAAAFESALALSRDYPEASEALADVRAAIALRDRQG